MYLNKIYCKSIHKDSGPILVCSITHCTLCAVRIDWKVCSIEFENVQYWNLKCFVFNQQKLMVEYGHYMRLEPGKNITMLNGCIYVKSWYIRRTYYITHRCICRNVEHLKEKSEIISYFTQLSMQGQGHKRSQLVSLLKMIKTLQPSFLSFL